VTRAFWRWGARGLTLCGGDRRVEEAHRLHPLVVVDLIAHRRLTERAGAAQDCAKLLAKRILAREFELSARKLGLAEGLDLPCGEDAAVELDAVVPRRLLPRVDQHALAHHVLAAAQPLLLGPHLGQPEQHREEALVGVGEVFARDKGDGHARGKRDLVAQRADSLDRHVGALLARADDERVLAAGRLFERLRKAVRRPDLDVGAARVDAVLDGLERGACTVLRHGQHVVHTLHSCAEQEAHATLLQKDLNRGKVPAEVSRLGLAVGHAEVLPQVVCGWMRHALTRTVQPKPFVRSEPHAADLVITVHADDRPALTQSDHLLKQRESRATRADGDHRLPVLQRLKPRE
jgi:hypothetical protein